VKVSTNFLNFVDNLNHFLIAFAIMKHLKIVEICFGLIASMLLKHMALLVTAQMMFEPELTVEAIALKTVVEIDFEVKFAVEIGLKLPFEIEFEAVLEVELVAVLVTVPVVELVTVLVVELVFEAVLVAVIVVAIEIEMKRLLQVECFEWQHCFEFEKDSIPHSYYLTQYL